MGVHRGDAGQGHVGGAGGPRTIRVVLPRTPWEGSGAAARGVPGRQGSDALRPRGRGRGDATGRAWVAWGARGGAGAGVGPARVGVGAGGDEGRAATAVAALGPHVRQDAADTRLGGAGPGGPT